MEDRADRTRILQRSLPANARRIPIPAEALGPWLAEIEDPIELKVTLRTVALITESVSRADLPASVSLHQLLDDTFLTQGCAGENKGCAGESIRAGLSAALERGTLLAARIRGEIRILLNDATNRRQLDRASQEPLSAAAAIGAARESTPIPRMMQEQPTAPRANIFALYEKHIGPYGHNMAEQLKAAESEFPFQWIEDAFAAALEQNVPNWHYIHAILRRWLQEGRYAELGKPRGPQRDQHHEHGKLGHDTAPDSRTGYLESYRRRHGHLPWETGEANSG